jgi:hypothetical protein
MVGVVISMSVVVAIMSYSGGAHKTITGTFTFFNQSVEQNIGALNFHSNISRNSNVYVLLSWSLHQTREILSKQDVVLMSEISLLFFHG